MTNRNHHIVIIEPSSVIYEGMFAIMENSDERFNVVRLEKLDEIPAYTLRKAVDIFIVSPVLIQNNLKTFNTIRDSLPQSKWIGIVYSYFDQQQLSVFDETISIYDTPDAIISLICRVVEHHEDDEQGNKERLTEREIEVLKLLTAGNSNKEIADQLNISIHTVISHRKNLSQKTGIKSVSGLTIYAVVKNIITLDNFKE